MHMDNKAISINIRLGARLAINATMFPVIIQRADGSDIMQPIIQPFCSYGYPSRTKGMKACLYDTKIITMATDTQQNIALLLNKNQEYFTVVISFNDETSSLISFLSFALLSLFKESGNIKEMNIMDANRKMAKLMQHHRQPEYVYRVLPIMGPIKSPIPAAVSA